MNFYKDFRLTWWQAALLKLSMVSLGIILGLVFPNTFASLMPFLVAIFILGAGYSAYIWYKQ